MLVTKKAFDFTQIGVDGDNTIKSFTLSKMLGKNGIVVFFYPKDFTFVCPSEIIAFDHKLGEFKARGYNVVGISTDSEFVHLAWKNTSINNGGIGKINFPLIADITKEISREFDVLFAEAVALRGTFILDKDLIVRHAFINDLPLGRNIDETIRMTDALNFFNEHGDVCPANWKKGQEGMKASPEGVKTYLTENWKDL